MRLSHWAQLAEVLSGFAVIITLVILILEVSDNTDATRALSYGHGVERLNAWRFELADNPELVRIFRGYRSGEVTDFSEDDLQRLDLVLSAMWAIYESAYYSRGYNTLGESEWGRYSVQVCRQFVQGKRTGYWKLSAARLTNEFSRFVESTCADESVGDSTFELPEPAASGSG